MILGGLFVFMMLTERRIVAAEKRLASLEADK